MRLLFLAALLLPSLAWAEDWAELGETPEAHVMLDAASVEITGDEAMARLKFIYRRVQPAQTISQGSPFDSTTNLYHIYCSAQRYQVLELNVLYKGKTVGTFHADPNPDRLDKPKLDSGVMLLIKKVCPGEKSGSEEQP
ncbi:MAG TPA: surface-adhesin E family protein [Gallionellaceae bacterium]